LGNGFSRLSSIQRAVCAISLSGYFVIKSVKVRSAMVKSLSSSAYTNPIMNMAWGAYWSWGNLSMICWKAAIRCSGLVLFCA